MPQPNVAPVSSVTIAGDLGLALHQQLRRAVEQRAALGDRSRRPRGEGSGGGVDRGARVLARRG